MPNDSGDTERRHGYTALAALIKETLGSLQARDVDVTLNTERLKTLVDITHEIKDQLTIMNGRVRQSEKDLVAIKANPPLTREHCDKRRRELGERIRRLEGRVPALVQNLVVAFITGSVFAIGGYLLSRLP